MKTKGNQNYINNELSKCIIDLLICEPYYAHLLSNVSRVITKDVKTAAVLMKDQHVQLLINPDFFMSEPQTRFGRVAVIKHEVLHLVFKHLFRDEAYTKHENIFNVAADLVVNQYIGKWHLPENAVTLETFRDLRLRPNERLEYYFIKIMKLSEELRNQPTNTLSERSDQKKSKGQQVKEGKHASDVEAGAALQEILQSDVFDGHQFWGSRAGQQDFTQHTLNSQFLDKIILEAYNKTPAKDIGNLPGLIRQQIDHIQQSMVPSVEWKKSIRIFSASGTRTKILYTNKRVSKRFGTRPGLRIRQAHKLLVAIDTSGSISDQELSIFFQEVDNIWKLGVEVFIAECDHAVQAFYAYTGKQPLYAKGRGGTSFDPVFSFLRDNPKLRFDGCIYLTDGYALEPKIKPPCKLLWIVTPNGNMGDHLKYGNKIKMRY